MCKRWPIIRALSPPNDGAVSSRRSHLQPYLQMDLSPYRPWIPVGISPSLSVCHVCFALGT